MRNQILVMDHPTAFLFLSRIDLRFCSRFMLPGSPVTQAFGRTLSLLKRFFWWPSMEVNTRSYVLSFLFNISSGSMGFPLTLCPQFISQVWKSFCQALGVTVSLSPGFHLQTNGQCEKSGVGSSTRTPIPPRGALS